MAPHARRIQPSRFFSPATRAVASRPAIPATPPPACSSQISNAKATYASCSSLSATGPNRKWTPTSPSGWECGAGISRIAEVLGQRPRLVDEQCDELEIGQLALALHFA